MSDICCCNFRWNGHYQWLQFGMASVLVAAVRMASVLVAAVRMASVLVAAVWDGFSVSCCSLGWLQC